MLCLLMVKSKYSSLIYLRSPVQWIPIELPEVPPMRVVFIGDSPWIIGDSVEAEFLLTRPATEVTCQLLGTTDYEGNCTFGLLYSI